jgi:hypothetical protein
MHALLSFPQSPCNAARHATLLFMQGTRQRPCCYHQAMLYTIASWQHHSNHSTLHIMRSKITGRYEGATAIIRMSTSSTSSTTSAAVADLVAAVGSATTIKPHNTPQQHWQHCNPNLHLAMLLPSSHAVYHQLLVMQCFHAMRSSAIAKRCCTFQTCWQCHSDSSTR